MRVRLIAYVALLAAAVACSDSTGIPEGMARARVLLTDAPFPYDQVEHVYVYVVSVAAATSADTSGGAEWVTIAEPRERFDLLALQGGETALVGEGDIPADQYAAVRLVIDTDSSSIVLDDGSEADVDWQGGGEKTLHALVMQPLALWDEGTEFDVIIDFDVGRSFLLVTPPTGPLGFLFIPWIRAVNEAGTGTLTGTVRGADAPSEVLEPVPEASITVYRYMEGWYGPIPGYVAATGRTDAQGRYEIHYLSDGDYLLDVRPPAGFDAGVALTSVVRVNMGGTTTLDVTLPQAGAGGEVIYLAGPSTVAMGDSGYFYAAVFGPGGDSVMNPAITWTSRNPSVAGMEIVAANAARLVPENLGSTWVVAAFADVADSILVSVVQSDSSGGGGEGGSVATVELSPSSQTVAVGDSAGFWATLRNAQGSQLSDRTVTWAATDTTVARFEFVYGQAVILRALKPGTITVTATSEGKSGSGTVTVN
jgi:Domain of unknown function (DUF4382)/Bacterial Ig-like domain (group 2)